MLRRKRNRRGLALMMVLSLLVLFLLMGVSFLMVANQTEKGARAQGKTERRGDAPRKHLDMTLGHVMRGTNAKGFATVIGGHDILGDLYGNDGADGTVESIVNSAATQTGGQFIEFISTDIARPWLTEAVAVANPTREPLPALAHYLNGRVITMVTGPAKGHSSRIVESGPEPAPGTQYYIRLEAFESDNDALQRPLLPQQGDRFIVNGQPFNGAGAGYNPGPTFPPGQPRYINDRKYGTTTLESALLPNFAIASPPAESNVGGADESYDAVDYQNMFLAMVLANAANSRDIIPSYHRPALVNYWQNRFTTSATTPADQKETIRRFVLRPTQLDHPNFTGSNPAFTFTALPAFSTTPTQAQLDALLAALLSGPWDVDNDNDGIPDSIWLDLEFPVITSRNGRSVKPLVAILVRDMDGRLNLNAHSSLVQAGGAYVNLATGQLITASGAFAGAANAPSTVPLPRGRGYGPAEIYFGHVLAAGNRATELNNLLNARYADPGASRPGQPGNNDPLSRIKALRFPSDYPSQFQSPYASPPDISGYDAVGLNFSGQALSEKRGMFPFPPPQDNPTVDEAYELDLSRFKSNETNALDSPFTVAEMERLLRFPDLDAAILPSRILDAAPTSFKQFSTPNQEARNLVTTESRHVPAPNTRLDFDQRDQPQLRLAGNPAQQQATRQAPTIADLLAARLRSGGFTGVADDQINLQLPFEIRRGQLMNLNRLFGNGFDDNNNGVVDDPAEADGGESVALIWKALGLPAAFDNAPFNFANDEPNMAVNRLQRQLYARHIYCLMMLLVGNGKDETGNLPPTSFLHDVFTQNGLSDDQKKELMARRIAQWAINVVEFRDPDAIMTPFEYDVDPFNANGWDTRIDGDPSTAEIANGIVDRRIVWGMEYPDLLIKEASAFHDRRVKDTEVDSTREKRQDGDKEGDNDLDQYRLPQGSLFLELYCPRNRVENDAAAYAKFPRELYDIQRSVLRGGQTVPVLQLGRMAPNGPLGQHPVWRVAISQRNQASGAVNTFTEATRRPDSISFQPEDMSLFGWQNRDPAAPVPPADMVDIERYIWFANVGPAANVSGLSVPNTRIYWNRHGNTDLPAGGYAVVGPRLVTHMGSQIEAPEPNLQTTKPKFLPSAQRIELRANGAVYYDRSGTAHAAVAGGGTQPALSVIAAAARPAAPAVWQRASADLGLGLGNDNVVGIGISVSEPFPDNYYPREPTTSLNAPDFPQDSWYDQADLALGLLPDEPFDTRAGMPLENLAKTGTTPHFKTAFLQRLASPLEFYHPQLNPYITVDWTQIDLTVFSGEEDTDRQFMITDPADDMKWIDPSDQDPYNAAPPEQFDSREKGLAKLALATPAPLKDVNLWTHLTTEPQNTARGAAPPDDYFKINLRNTFGLLNSTFGAPRNMPAAYVGDPVEPWPWLTWNNRPFDTPLELMNVPASTLARLPHEFTFQTIPASPTPNPYGDSNRDDLLGAYHHLLNFFNTSSSQYTSPHFYRLFEYVETPSPFVGTERWYSPQSFAAGSAADGFRPPFNYLSRFRDPGRININTIFDRAVWEGLTKGFPDMDPTGPKGTAAWDSFLASRQGYPGAFGVLDTAFPTRFAQPFRSPAQADSAPLPNLRTTGVQAGLLRSTLAQANQPLFDFASTTAHNNTDRNPAFRYAGIQRLSNLVSTHSNVFAIWITVGYFEVEAVPFNVNRTGYRLGQEVGLDTGEVERHRAFYMVDRSIPVAYEPGENHNIDNCILIRRVIE